MNSIRIKAILLVLSVTIAGFLMPTLTFADDACPRILQSLTDEQITGYGADLPKKLQDRLTTAYQPSVLTQEDESALENTFTETLELGAAWIRYATNTEKTQIIGTIEQPIEPINTSSTSVIKIELNGESFYFRRARSVLDEFYDFDAARKSLAAYFLQQSLGLQSSVKSRLAKIYVNEYGRPKEWVGVISSEAKGKRLELDGSQDRARKLEKLSSPENLNDVMAFEFLIGNRDVHTLNFFISEEKTIEVFDYDKAFNIGILPYDSSRPIGTRLPNGYSKDFIRNLELLTAAKIVQLLSSQLTKAEIQSILIRRRVLLIDALAVH